MNECCGDNRFEIIAAYKRDLLDGTNIETSPEEMAVVDNILFRFWQMGWLKEKPQTNAVRIRSMTDEELAEWISDTMDCSECEHRYAGEGKPCHNGMCCPDYWLDWLKEEASE